MMRKQRIVVVILFFTLNGIVVKRKKRMTTRKISCCPCHHEATLQQNQKWQKKIAHHHPLCRKTTLQQNQKWHWRASSTLSSSSSSHRMELQPKKWRCKKSHIVILFTMKLCNSKTKNDNDIQATRCHHPPLLHIEWSYQKRKRKMSTQKIMCHHIILLFTLSGTATKTKTTW